LFKLPSFSVRYCCWIIYRQNVVLFKVLLTFVLCSCFDRSPHLGSQPCSRLSISHREHRPIAGELQDKRFRFHSRHIRQRLLPAL
jgi:hypothetical protein